MEHDPTWAGALHDAAVYGFRFDLARYLIGAGLIAGSLSLQADALDFLGDAGNYALTLFVLGMTLKARATAALVKGATMVVLGVFVLVQGVVHAVIGTVPHAEIMGATALTALLANAAVAAMLYRYRDGDSNARSVWLCSRNDVLANLAVLLAASGVFALGPGNVWVTGERLLLHWNGFGWDDGSSDSTFTTVAGAAPDRFFFPRTDGFITRYQQP